MTGLEWAETYRILSTEESPDFGGAKFSSDNAPVMRGILSLVGTRGIKRMVGQKSAQITWTAGVICTVLGYHAHWRPSVQVVMFPREKSAKDFDAEKFSPMVRATPVLNKRIKLLSRAAGNSATRKHYAGGLAKFVASNSPSDVKSTSATVMIVEEPDDTNRDVKGQGKSITMLRERGKTVRDSFMLIGGTPTAKGASEVEAEMRTTDQRRFMVVCHDCGERHDLDWDNVTIPGFNLTDDVLSATDIDERYPQREVYGRAQFENAFYTCPHCASIWSDDERIANIRRTASGEFPDYGWVATAQSADPGFYYNELQSVFDGSRVPVLAEKYLRAKDLMDRGDQSEMISFWNSSRGLAWEYKGDLPEEDELRERAEDYAEWSCPAGALIPKLTVDVQHDRLALTCWVAGRADERWLAYWGEIYGATVVPHAGAWVELEKIITTQTIRHASGAQLRIAAVAVDCSDGQTSDAVYSFVRRHNTPGRAVYAIKGASDSVGRVEIWTPPKQTSIDPNQRSTKASKYGVIPHIIGTAKAKDLILGWSEQGGQVRLQGSGPGRMHWYKGVRDDFFEQLLSEIKIPSRFKASVREWKPRTDRRNEVLDDTVYDTWLSRQMRLHLKKPWEWDLIEMRIKQADMLSDVPPPSEPSNNAGEETTEEASEQPGKTMHASAQAEANQADETDDTAAPEPSAAPTQPTANYLAMIHQLRRQNNVQR
jgi:phage terminase large subunit GpA-like protein